MCNFSVLNCYYIISVEYNSISPRYPGYSAHNTSSCVAASVSPPARAREPCAAQLPAICVAANPVTFPRLAEFVRVRPEQDRVSFQTFPNEAGWRVDYSVDMWPSNRK